MDGTIKGIYVLMKTQVEKLGEILDLAILQDRTLTDKERHTVKIVGEQLITLMKADPDIMANARRAGAI